MPKPLPLMVSMLFLVAIVTPVAATAMDYHGIQPFQNLGRSAPPYQHPGQAPAPQVIYVRETAPAPQQGTLSVTVDQEYADILIDGGKMTHWNSVSQQPLSPGTHSIRVEKEGYETWVGEVTIRGGDQSHVYAQLTPTAETLRKQKMISVEVRSNPAGAAVYLDGEIQGKTPCTVTADPGTYTLRIALPGYRDHVEELDLTKNIPIISVMLLGGESIGDTASEKTQVPQSPPEPTITAVSHQEITTPETLPAKTPTIIQQILSYIAGVLG